MWTWVAIAYLSIGLLFSLRLIYLLTVRRDDMKAKAKFLDAADPDDHPWIEWMTIPIQFLLWPLVILSEVIVAYLVRRKVIELNESDDEEDERLWPFLSRFNT